MQASFAAFIFARANARGPAWASLSSNRLQRVTQVSRLWRQTVIEYPQWRRPRGRVSKTLLVRGVFFIRGAARPIWGAPREGDFRVGFRNPSFGHSKRPVLVHSCVRLSLLCTHDNQLI